METWSQFSKQSKASFEQLLCICHDLRHFLFTMLILLKGCCNHFFYAIRQPLILHILQFNFQAMIINCQTINYFNCTWPIILFVNPFKQFTIINLFLESGSNQIEIAINIKKTSSINTIAFIFHFGQPKKHFP